MSLDDDDLLFRYFDAPVDHLRMVQLRDEPIDIILDSGADGSVLPLVFGNVGQSVKLKAQFNFLDAQGTLLNISNTKLAAVVLDDVSFKEEFLIASVTSLLVSLADC